MIKATLVLIVATLVIPRLRRRSAAERHLLWAASLGAASLLPLLSFLLPSWQPEWARHVMGALPSSFDPTPSWTVGRTADIVVRANGIEAAAWAIGNVVTLVWMLGAGVALLILIAEAVKLGRLAFDAQPDTVSRRSELVRDVSRALKLTRAVRLLKGPQRIIPMTWGLWHPRVMLPQSAAEWPDDRTRAVLAHELAHIRRCDWIVHVLAELSCAVYWFHPLFWIAKRCLSRESEQSADDVVLALGVDGSEYATHLLEIVRTAQPPVRAWSPTLAMARASQLERRFAALLNVGAHRGGITRRKAVAAAAIATLLAIPLAAMSARDMNVHIEIQTTNLPAITEITLISSQARAQASVPHVRAAGLRETADAVAPPDVVEYTAPPLYSDDARNRRVEGIVTAGVRVETDGHVSDAFVVRGLGFGLDQNALVALRQWRFRAGARNGVPVAMEAEVDIEFSLQSDAVNALIANDMATRVGPGVTPPRVVRRELPRTSRNTPRGTVVLDIVLLEDGRPRIVRILRSLDAERDDLAVRTFELWRFSPATKDGRPVKVRMNAEVNFHG